MELYREIGEDGEKIRTMVKTEINSMKKSIGELKQLLELVLADIGLSMKGKKTRARVELRRP